MGIGFVIWSITSAVTLGIGIWSYRSKEPVGFYSGVKPPKVKDTKKYNHAVAFLWFGYAALFEIMGIPLLFLKQNSAGFVLPLLGTVLITIGLVVGYTFIERKYRVD
ncbi:MAG: hypothetical protein K5857_08215 [Lachnospiraceae bacterium]|nr:hypothetical protein [Lachnospiraceae bacterium]